MFSRVGVEWLKTCLDYRKCTVAKARNKSFMWWIWMLRHWCSTVKHFHHLPQSISWRALTTWRPEAGVSVGVRVWGLWWPVMDSDGLEVCSGRAPWREAAETLWPCEGTKKMMDRRLEAAEDQLKRVCSKLHAFLIVHRLVLYAEVLLIQYMKYSKAHKCKKNLLPNLLKKP